MNPLAKWLKNASNMFVEKPQVQVDEFGLEHFLLYHGLVGSSPENQRQFKDVRADISSAVARGNSHNLCINFKLAPLWWEDKLYRIFAELKEKSPAQTVATLLPEKSDDYEVHDFDPLRHQDWRVRANAALILAYLQEKQGEERIIKAMQATADGTTPAFCHLSRAVATFRSQSGKEALTSYLSHSEPWIRVDAVNALARWPLTEVGDVLSEAFQEHHDFLDYAAVALARQHQPETILKEDGENLGDLGAALTIGLLEASRHTFSSNGDLLYELGLHRCLGPLQKAVEAKANPVRVRALYNLAAWLDENYSLSSSTYNDYPSRAGIDAALNQIKDDKLRRDLVAAIEAIALGSNTEQTSPMRHSLKLIGELSLDETSELLLALVDSNKAVAHRNEIVEAMGKLGKEEFSTKLTTLANSLVDLSMRTQRPLSASPVVEADADTARTYWFVLKALGNIPDRRSFDLLLKATGDFAADKREEAIQGAIRLWQKANWQDKVGLADLKGAVTKALNDPSAQVKLKALEGAAILNLPDMVPTVAKLVLAQETSVAKGAFETLDIMAANGQKAAVCEALTELRRSQTNASRNKKIDDLLSRLG